MFIMTGVRVEKQTISMSSGLSDIVRKHDGYISNGFGFNTKQEKVIGRHKTIVTA